MDKLSIVSEKEPLNAFYIPTPLVSEPVTHIWLMKEVYEAFYKLNRDLQDAGMTPLVGVRGYQCFAYQKKLYLKEVQRQIRAGLKEPLAYERAKEHIAPPGCSEHQLAYSIDLALNRGGTLDRLWEFEASDQFAWLRAYAKEYGFILRYPKYKENFTGQSYKPWHYRYIGVGHAKKMSRLNLCLEEYKEQFYNYQIHTY